MKKTLSSLIMLLFSLFIYGCKNNAAKTDSKENEFHELVEEATKIIYDYIDNTYFELDTILLSTINIEDEFTIKWRSYDQDVRIVENVIKSIEISKVVEISVTFYYNDFRLSKTFDILVNKDEEIIYNNLSIEDALVYLSEINDENYEDEEIYKITGIIVSKYKNDYILYSNNQYIRIKNIDSNLINKEITFIGTMAKTDNNYFLVYKNELRVLREEVQLNERYISRTVTDFYSKKIQVPMSKIIKVEMIGHFNDTYISDYGRYNRFDILGVKLLKDFEIDDFVNLIGYFIYDNDEWILIIEGSFIDERPVECPSC